MAQSQPNRSAPGGARLWEKLGQVQFPAISCEIDPKIVAGPILVIGRNRSDLAPSRLLANPAMPEGLVRSDTRQICRKRRQNDHIGRISQTSRQPRERRYQKTEFKHCAGFIAGQTFVDVLIFIIFITSIQARIQDRERSLLPFQDQTKANIEALPFDYRDYLQLVDWTGRVIRDDKRGAIPADTPPILERLSVNPKVWALTTKHYGRWYYRIVGTAESLKAAAGMFRQKCFRGVPLDEIVQT